MTEWFQRNFSSIFIMNFLVFAFLSSASQSHAQYLLIDGRLVEPLEIFQECDVCPEMIVVPEGRFIMGSVPGESRWQVSTPSGDVTFLDMGADEQPAHEVLIDIPFAIARNEVTYDQWMMCIHGGGCGGHIPRNVVIGNSELFGVNRTVVLEGNNPVIDISFLDIRSYVEWLNSQVGGDVYRIPTEAEWEYAARAGTQTRFAQGDSISFEQANFNSPDADSPRPRTPYPVDFLDAANRWGIRHMSGNVAERTSSCWTETYAGWSRSSEYLLQSDTVSCRRVTRGGDHSTPLDFLRTAQRGFSEQDRRSLYVGFRIIREFR